MNEGIPIVVVVMGYGCRRALELVRYLDEVAAFVNRRMPQMVVLCGGHTQQQSTPGRNEASVMLEYLEEPGVLKHWPLVRRAMGSFTTRESIEEAASIIEAEYGRRYRTLQVPQVRIVIFCEASRSLKVNLDARHVFGFLPKHDLPHVEIRTVSWELKHPFYELWATIVEVGALYVPGVARYLGWKKRRRARRA